MRNVLDRATGGGRALLAGLYALASAAHQQTLPIMLKAPLRGNLFLTSPRPPRPSEAAARAIKERKGDRAALAEAFRSAITRVHELENELLFMP
jgi:hypothetical protein